MTTFLNGLKAIDLFSGSGAVSSGLKSEGFQVLAAIDNDAIACQTYRLNHPEVHLLEGDIRKVNARQLKKVLNHKGPLDLLVVCAPCQPFSQQNKKRSQSDVRANLILEMLPFVEVFSPQVVFIENVPGIAADGPIQQLTESLSQYGYFLSKPLTKDAAEFGVPQRRKRCIMIASPNKKIAESFGQDIQALPRKTVADAIKHLPSLRAGEVSLTDALHRARRHEAITLERLKYIPKNGGSRSSLPSHLELECHKGIKSSGYSDVYGRMKWDDVAPTLTTGCTEISKGRFAHPIDDRGISLREAALLQTFPPDYQFFGNVGQISRQIGNAVPVDMIKALVPYLKSAIKGV